MEGAKQKLKASCIHPSWKGSAVISPIAELKQINFFFVLTALKGCRGIVFTYGVRMGLRGNGQVDGQVVPQWEKLSGLYLRNCKV